MKQTFLLAGPPFLIVLRLIWTLHFAILGFCLGFCIAPEVFISAAQAQTPASTNRTPDVAPLNVLVLALDEADIKAARPANLAPPDNTRWRADDLPPLSTTPTNPATVNPATVNPVEFDGGADFQPTAAVNSPDSRRRDADRRDADRRDAGRGAGATQSTIPDLPSLVAPGEESELEMPARRPPGRAQSAAAPLRRALVSNGVRDVLTTPLDGPTVIRTVNAGRLGMRTLDGLRLATGQLLQAGATPDQASPEIAAARRSAIEAAARIGLVLEYRAVVVLAVSPLGEYSLLLVDVTRATGEVIIIKAEGDSPSARDEGAAASAAVFIAGKLNEWPAFTAADRASKLESHMQAARAAIDRDEFERAHDQLLQAVSLDASYSDAYVLLGDILRDKDPNAAASAYQRAAEINTRNGGVWARIAIVHTLSRPPDWVRALQAAGKAQALGYDSANMRTAMAAAEFGRADLFRRGGRPDQAQDAELVARRHLERARELAPDDPEVVASISRLMAKYLLEQKRYKEAVQSLDLLATQYPSDLPTQLMFAKALEGYGRREEDLFVAWARVWQLGGESEVTLDSTRYARIADGFDQRLFALARNIFQMTSGVASGALLRETALLQAERTKAEMNAAISALKIMRPPAGRAVSDAHVNRLFAADLMQQALEFYTQYLETGQELNYNRAIEVHRQAIESLNIARLGGRNAGL